MNDNLEYKEENEVKNWLAKIAKAEQHYHDYHETIKKIRQYYRGDIKNDKQNIFWSSIETLKPFLYFKQPKPYIARKEKSSDKSQNYACMILERALLWDLEQFDFDSVIKYARNDFLLAGSGMVIERYRPRFGLVNNQSQEPVEIKIDEQVRTEYLDPLNFIADSEKVGIWEDCTWFAIRQYMTFASAIAAFGENIAKGYFADAQSSSKTIEVYEVWDKSSKRVLFLSRHFPNHFLKVVEGGLSLDNFYPIPKPIFATTTNDSIVPVPDYIQIKPLLDELDGVTSRMEKTMKAIKVSGCYDNAFPELASILNKEVTLVSVSDFDRLKSAGGIKNIVDFMPIEQYINALQALALRRQDLVNAIYEITGVSDIMRGSSNSNETATAVVKKTNFGTLRNQDRQNDMQRFIAEIFKIKAEIICEHFSKDKLLSFLPIDERTTSEAIAAVEMLKQDRLRGMILGVDSETAGSEEQTLQNNNMAINAIHTLISQAFDVVSKQPLLLDLYRQMISSLVAILPNARQYDSVLEHCFDKIAEEFNQPDAPQSEFNLQQQLVQSQKQKDLAEISLKKEQNDIKRMELLLKYQNKNVKSSNNQ
ncbi:MAG: hypothetical protein IKK52_02705 [Alphaproteobacteria bacterium]|nr:hypothetical protein [Alphaproteobacteria bacterium]